MKKLVLFVAIVAAVALSACKKEAPAVEVEEPQIEAPAEAIEPAATDEAAPVEEAAPAEEAPAPAAE
jgi:hypothetical protein